ncbi:MAG: ribonuclease R [Alphaproteobacteria bacterium]|nr:ribonuclease R [Alphaproteobacteria bacterium]
MIPTDKKNRNIYDIAESDMNGAERGQIVVGEIQPVRGIRQTKIRVAEVIGNMNDPKAISLIAIHEKGLRSEFSAAVIEETKNMKVPDLKGREDLRKLPLVTIDPADARDRDDAVYAEKTADGGYRITVAIADVSHYVRHGSALDKEAFARGNSTYFPDRVVPMLPEQLSNNLCSLAPKENRACIAVHMTIDKHGQMQKYQFVRGIMNSLAALSYEQAQAAMKDGITDDTTGPLLEPVLKPLFEAYKILRAAREKRGALDLVIPERKIVVDEKGNMTGVKVREHFEAHEVIEEMMVLANVAAASALEDKDKPCVYRIHDKPTPQKLESLGEYLQAFGVSLPKGQVPQPGQLNEVLKKVADHPYKHLVSDAMLRSQARAEYNPENIGHFGLALKKYAHFTSPIRRYADLVVHRSLINAFNLGNDGLKEVEVATLAETAAHISATERTSAEAERTAVDRFTAAYLSQHIGSQFAGRIRGVTRAGLFIELSETGADGFVPMRMLPRDQYVHDEKRHCLVGRHSGRIFRLGASVTATIVDAERTTGSTILELVGAEHGADIPGADFGDSPLPFGGGGNRRGNGHGRGNRHRGGPKHGR